MTRAGGKLIGIISGTHGLLRPEALQELKESAPLWCMRESRRALEPRPHACYGGGLMVMSTLLL
jgi:hypothetical protein